MHIEIAQAIDFLGRLLQARLDEDKLSLLKHELAGILKARFANHWDPQQPSRGNGYRSISNLNGQLDPVLAYASKKAGVSAQVIHLGLPRDFVLWIDPFSVAYRVSDHGNIMTLYEDRSRGRITLKVDPNTLPKSPALSPHLRATSSSAVRISPPPSPHNMQRIATPSSLASSPLARHARKQEDQAVMAN
ncbi:BTG-domain-containing protein [Lichtheimia hyalospora FSU 10163]|nr:BTG-domain-containing protein [Lichtheimia hyalospora FSU 10163]